MTCIETDNLAVTFDTRTLWQELSLRVERGRRVRIAGPSGCGKSTLLKCLMGVCAGLFRDDSH